MRYLLIILSLVLFGCDNVEIDSKQKAFIDKWKSIRKSYNSSENWREGKIYRDQADTLMQKNSVTNPNRFQKTENQNWYGKVTKVSYNPDIDKYTCVHLKSKGVLFQVCPDYYSETPNKFNEIKVGDKLLFSGYFDDYQRWKDKRDPHIRIQPATEVKSLDGLKIYFLDKNALKTEAEETLSFLNRVYDLDSKIRNDRISASCDIDYGYGAHWKFIRDVEEVIWKLTTIVYPDASSLSLRINLTYTNQYGNDDSVLLERINIYDLDEIKKYSSESRFQTAQPHMPEIRAALYKAGFGWDRK